MSDQAQHTPHEAQLVALYGPPDNFAADSATVEPDEYHPRHRAARARALVLTYLMQHGDVSATEAAGYVDDVTVEGVEEYVSDVVCDLLHFATSRGADADDVLASAMLHFRSEAGLGYE